MKKLIYIISMLAFVSPVMTSCNYLEVDEMGIVSAEEMFTTKDGFESAMYGAYSAISSKNLYGQSLTYGFIETLTHQYDNPSQSNDYYNKSMAFDYKSQQVRPTIDNIWTKAYQTISYLNNIIINTENGVLTDHQRALYKGEALGLRAYLHFDLLRMFSKRYEGNASERGVPYQTDFSTDVPPTGTIEETCELIIADLKEAESLLSSIDTYDSSLSGTYYKEQSIHFNLYAVKGLMARVYLYSGDNTNAAIKAAEVIESGKFSLNAPLNIKGINSFYPNGTEAVFGVYRKALYSDIYNRYLNNSGIGDAVTSFLKVRTDVEELYEQTTFTDTHNDYRLDAYFSIVTDASYSSTTFLARYGSEEYTSSSIMKNVAYDMTLIQLPEMYYIYCEAAYDTNPDYALEVFNSFIATRGLRSATAPVDKQGMVDLIYNDRHKEYFGTGDYFLDSKRLNKDLVNFEGETLTASDAMYVFPWPDLENEYGVPFTNL